MLRTYEVLTGEFEQEIPHSQITDQHKAQQGHIRTQMSQGLDIIHFNEWRLFNSGTYAPPYHIAVRNRWKQRYFQRGLVSNIGLKFCLNPFTLSKVIESLNMLSRNTLAKIVCV